jgi:hypothetical protein
VLLAPSGRLGVSRLIALALMDVVPLTVEAFAIAGTVLPKSAEALFAPEAERIKVSKTAATRSIRSCA